MKLARQLVDTLGDEWDPRESCDTYAEVLRQEAGGAQRGPRHRTRDAALRRPVRGRRPWMSRGGRTTGFLALVAVMLASAACASTPTGPSVLVLPGTGKSHDQFRVEDAQCRERASRELQTTDRGTVSDQNRYDMVYVQCMYAQGNQVPVPGRGWRSPTREAPPAAARPPGIPPPPEGVPPSPPPATPR